MEASRPVRHAATIERLWRAARGGRLPHALLFEGRAGIGKYLAARWFARGCLCARGPGEPCGECGPCRRVGSGGERGNHADLFVIDPVLEEQERILVGRIAERSGEDVEPEQSLQSFLGLRPLEGAWRVVLVRECHRMNVNAQNAFLKALEEPRPGTLMVLETHRPSALLATIKSRCIRIRFETPTREECAAVLVASGLEPAAAQELALLSEGSPGLALAMARGDLRALRERVAAVVRREHPALDAAAEIWELDGEFAGKTEGARERERVRAVLELAQAVVRDAWRLRAGVPADDLPHAEVASVLAQRSGARELARLGEYLTLARADVERNLAPGVLLERALLALAEGPPAAQPSA